MVPGGSPHLRAATGRSHTLRAWVALLNLPYTLTGDPGAQVEILERGAVAAEATHATSPAVPVEGTVPQGLPKVLLAPVGFRVATAVVVPPALAPGQMAAEDRTQVAVEPAEEAKTHLGFMVTVVQAPADTSRFTTVRC